MSREVLSSGACYAQNVPRKSVVFLMPSTPMAPFEEAVIQAIVQRIVERLHLDSLMVESHTFSTGVHVLCLFHGNAPKQSVSTFDKEHRRPKRLRYTPNKKLMLIFDTIGGLFYISAQRQDIGGLLAVLNGTLFPNRAPDAAFKTLSVSLNDLSACLYMTLPARTYSQIQLKALSGYDFGYNATRGTLEWAEDGFTAFHLRASEWPPYAKEARLLIHPKGYKTAFTLTVFDGTGVIKAPLSEKTFLAIAEVLRRCTDNYDTWQQIPVTYIVQEELDFIQDPALSLRLGEVDDARYVVLEEAIPRVCEAPPKPFACSCTPCGKRSLKCCPYSLTDALRIIHAYQNDPSVHCIVFSHPGAPSKITPEALVSWATAAAKQTQKAICVCEPGQKYLCGTSPYCRTHQGSKAIEQCETFGSQAADYNTFSQAVRDNFKGLENDELLIMHRWSTEDEPGQSGYPISVTTLAKLLGCSSDKIYRTIRKAEELNAKIVALMKKVRKDRAKITHGYTVDDRTAARDADD